MKQQLRIPLVKRSGLERGMATCMFPQVNVNLQLPKV